MLAANQREQELKFERVFPIASTEPDGDHVVQLPPGPLRPRFGIRTADGERRAHRLLRLRAGAHRARALQHARPRRRRAGRGGPRPALASTERRRARRCSARPATYRPHALHAPGPAFPETNCYTDLWIELLHALGLEPLAMLAFCVVGRLRRRSVDVLQAAARGPRARSTASRCRSSSSSARCSSTSSSSSTLGRTVIVEVDAFYLPDTAGRSYREQHEKTSIGVEAIDVEQRARCGYFHSRASSSSRARTSATRCGSGGRSRRTSCRPTSSSCATTGSHRRPPSSCATAAAELLAVQLERLPARRTRSRASASASSTTCRACSRRPARIPRVRVRDRAPVRRRVGGSAARSSTGSADGEAGPRRDRRGRFDALAGAAKTLLFKLARAGATGSAARPGAGDRRAGSGLGRRAAAARRRRGR